MIIIKKGQTWSLDAIFAAAIFLIVFVFAAMLLTDLFEVEKSKELNQESQRILQQLSSGIGPQLIKGNTVDIENVETLLNMSYDDLKNLLGVKNDFCIYFEDSEGRIILINESFVGFGDPDVTINGMPCGPGGCFNKTDLDGDNYSGTVGCGQWDCDDSDNTVYPKNKEANNISDPECFDGKDNDCDLLTDRKDPDCCIDYDGDGYSPMAGCTPLIDCVDNLSTSISLGYSPPLGNWSNCPVSESDCNITTLSCPICIHPLAPDPCGDNIDSNCMVGTEECLGWDFNCTYEIGICPADTITLMGFSSTANAHMSVWNSSAYANFLCCKSLDDSNKMVRGSRFNMLSLSGESNAHAELYERNISELCGNGTDGILDSTAILNTDLNENFNYTYVNITAADTITITGDNPLIIRAKEYIYLDGAILDVSGESAGDVTCIVSSGDNKGGEGIAGGGDGGNGGTQNSLFCNSSINGGRIGLLGTGPGAGEGGEFYDADGDCNVFETDTATEGGAGGSYASKGTNGLCGPSCSLESNSGSTYGDETLGSFYGRIPLMGGSGGGGGASDYEKTVQWNGAGGGAGGGAIMLIAPKIIIRPGSAILSNGGNGGNANSCGTASPPNSAGGGGGSGGTIYLIAETIENYGTLSVIGGSGGIGLGGSGGDGGDGRIRIDTVGLTGGDEGICGIIENDTNIALGKTATQSSLYGSGTYLGCDYGSASYAVDSLCSFHHTTNTAGEWLKVDLGEPKTIDQFRIQKRAGCCYSRPNTYQIQVSDTGVFGGEETIVVDQSVSSCSTSGCIMEHSITPITTRYVRILNTAAGGTDAAYMNIAEFEIYSAPIILSGCFSGCEGFTGNLPSIGDGTGYCGVSFFKYDVGFDIEEPEAVSSLVCTYEEGGCNIGQHCIMTLSGDIDAHAATCDSPAAYSNAVCCSMETTCVC